MAKGSKRITQRCAIMSGTITGTILDFIAREYAPRRHASKLLARAAKTSHRTAERWLRGDAIPSGENLMNLLVECEDLANDVNRLVAELRKKRDGQWHP